jgi:hypothetical protein
MTYFTWSASDPALVAAQALDGIEKDLPETHRTWRGEQQFPSLSVDIQYSQ